MREKELRLALVCFGGVSLAVYMHGVSKEIVKLARASAAYNRSPDHAARQSGDYAGHAPPRGDPADSEVVYFNILKALGQSIDLRIIVDAVAGASAGGINGIFLSRAIAHDLDYDGLRHLWLQEADVARLSTAPEPRGIWNQLLIKPAVKFVTRRMLGSKGLGARVSEKLPSLVRLRTLKPPFDGVHLVRILYDALVGMGRPRAAEASLMPSGHRLDTNVTVTDFYGFLRQLPLHDPPMISELEHRHTLTFTFVRWRNGEIESDFDHDGVPALTFAARATSSFPGAFPPANLSEIDTVLDERGLVWRAKDRFFVRNFGDYLRAGLDPHRTSFIDGAVLNNKPFAAAIRSIQGRPAYREVDRRIVYIDPHPDELMPPPSGVTPNLWRTLKAALSDIPRNEPVHDDLAEIQAFNKQVQMVRAVIDAIRPQVGSMVREIVEAVENKEVTTETIRLWRIGANSRAARDAGYSFEGYTRLKIQTAVRYLSGIVADICGFAWESPAHRKLHQVLEIWVFKDPLDNRGTVPDYARRDPASLPNWVRFLTTFDIDYQRRRLRFVISELNRLYHRGEEDEWRAMNSHRLDALKASFYDCLTDLREYDSGTFATPELRGKFYRTFADLENGAADGSRAFDAKTFCAAHLTEIDAALAELSAEIGLEKKKIDADAILAEVHGPDWPPALAHELVESYLGFPFWDVITFSIMGSREVGEFNEIKVDRISPNDAKSLAQGDARALLKGVAMRHFGAFFSRKDRENDYLWGRLNAAERLIDILIDAGRQEGGGPELNITEFKRQIFQAIINAERPHLPASESLILKLDERLKAL